MLGLCLFDGVDRLEPSKHGVYILIGEHAGVVVGEDRQQ